jgi:hypothetical protein
MYEAWGTWGASWWWSLVLVAITVAIHAFGVVFIKHGIDRFQGASRRPAFLYTTRGSVSIIVIAALLLASLHAIESLIWAWVYLLVGAIPTPADAALYSVDSMTTRGASGLVLSPQWRMMGATEAGDGMLLFGISTAFLFYVLQRLWRLDASRGE